MADDIMSILMGSEDAATRAAAEQLIYWWIEQEILLAYCPAYIEDGVEYRPWQYGYWQ